MKGVSFEANFPLEDNRVLDRLEGLLQPAKMAIEAMPSKAIRYFSI